MLKKIRLVRLVVSVLAFCLLSVSLPRSVLAADELNVRSAIVMDVKTGKVLYEQDADRRIPPASLTKVMSMLITLDTVRAQKAALNDTVKISRNAARQGGSKMHIKQGERISLNNLLMGMAVSSGNDASMAVAEHIGGSGAQFVRLMNARARQLGMVNTSFKNPNGLPAQGQITTARDMGLLARHYLRTYPEALRYHNTRTLTHRGQTTTNKNPLLGAFPGADGLKTGWINASGYNIISTVDRNGTRLLAVILGAPTSSIRSEEIKRLMEASFDAQRQGKTVASILNANRPAASQAVASSAKAERKTKATAGKRAGKSQKATVSQKAKTSKNKANLSSSSTREKNKSKTQARPRESKTDKGALASSKKKTTDTNKPVKAATAQRKSSKEAAKRTPRSSTSTARADASRSTSL